MDPLDPRATFFPGLNQTPSPTVPSQSQLLADALDAYAKPAPSSLLGPVTPTAFDPGHAAALADALDAYARPGAPNAPSTNLPLAGIPASFDDPIGLGRLFRRQTGPEPTPAGLGSPGPAGISPILLSAAANGPRPMAAHPAALPLQQGAGPRSGAAPQPAAAPTQAPTTVAPVTGTGPRQPWYADIGQRVEDLLFGKPLNADSLNRSDWGRFAHTDTDNTAPAAPSVGGGSVAVPGSMTADQLRAALPGSGGQADIYANPLSRAMASGGMTSPYQRAAFLGQVSAETGDLNHVREDLNYNQQNIKANFGRRFPDPAAMAPYAHNPEGLADFVYAHRNGNRGGDDGYRYRGGGLIQITGRANYAAVGHEGDPEALEDPNVASDTAVQHWNNQGLNHLPDVPLTREQYDAVSRTIAGRHAPRASLDRRWNAYQTALGALAPGS